MVGGELLEDGRPAYRDIIISVPRQNGKTTLVLAWELDRALSWGRRQRIIYSAQTGRDAREKLLEDQVPILEGSSFKAAIQKVDRTNGGEAVLFKGGSRISVVASSESAGHGKTIGLGVVDEAFDDVDNRREQALTPAMRTVRDAQLIVCSTMGTDKSLYLNRKIDAGRAFALEDKDDARTAYFEWSAPEDADIADPAVWAACTPALGFTVDLDTIRAELEQNRETPGEFKRFALNQRTASDERVIPEAIWNAALGDANPQNGVLAVDCSHERDWASIGRADRNGHVTLLEHRPGTAWVAARVAELGKTIWLDPSGPAGAFTSELERAGVKVEHCAGRDMLAACGFFYDGVADQKLLISKNADLDAAVAAVARRVSGDAWLWSRKNLTDISPLVAVTIAAWAAQQAGGPSKYFSADELWSD